MEKEQYYSLLPRIVNFAAFAAEKLALHALSQSMARELGRKDIRVTHIIIDGPIDASQQV